MSSSGELSTWSGTEAWHQYYSVGDSLVGGENIWCQGREVREEILLKRDWAVKWLSGVAIEVEKRIISWLVNSKVLARPRHYMVRIIQYAYQHKTAEGLEDLGERGQRRRRKAIALITAIRGESEMLQARPFTMGDGEAFLIYSTAQNTGKIEGDIAEVGVFKGGSAKLICEAKGGRTLHLFDTFKGIPSVGEEDAPFHVGQFAASLDSVSDYLKDYRNVHFHEGIFPETAEPVKNNRFSFVHLDVDTHESTLACLTFFYPRLSQGGVIITHDSLEPGVNRAFYEYFEDKPEPIIELFHSQALVVKTCPTSGAGGVGYSIS